MDFIENFAHVVDQVQVLRSQLRHTVRHAVDAEGWRSPRNRDSDLQVADELWGISRRSLAQLAMLDPV